MFFFDSNQIWISTTDSQLSPPVSSFAEMGQMGAALINADVTKVIDAKSGYSNASNKAIYQGCSYKEGRVRE